jgi:hypothetical protein
MLVHAAIKEPIVLVLMYRLGWYRWFVTQKTLNGRRNFLLEILLEIQLEPQQQICHAAMPCLSKKVRH